MNQTERPAAIFFAEFLLPLRYANVRRGVAYLERQKRPSYWSGIASRTGGMERFSVCPDARALLASLGAYWAGRHEANLVQLLPHLEKMRQELMGAGRPAEPAEERLPDFIYPLF